MNDLRTAAPITTGADMTEKLKPCEYCGARLPLGVDKKTRQMRSYHFARCEKRPKPEPTAPDPATSYARSIAVALHARHYPEVTQWMPLDDTMGLLTQIDNMTCALVRAEAASTDPLVGMSEINRTVAYCAASKLRELGYEWTGREWAAPTAVEAVAITAEQVESLVRVTDIPRMMCKRALVKANGDFEQAKELLRTGTVDATPPREPLSDEQIMDLTREEAAHFRWPSSAIAIARAVIAADRGEKQ